MERRSQEAGQFRLVPLECQIDGANLMNWNSLYKLVKKIPRGCVSTYGRIARVVRLPGGARAAGRAMAGCPSGQAIPWHRVVGAGGRLLLREPNVGLQRKLLESEGVQVAEKRILNFAAHEWLPGKARGGRARAGKRMRRRGRKVL